MPKYIKDGAYTIIVDERSVSTKRTQSPKTVGSNSDDELEDQSVEPEDQRDVNQDDEWLPKEEEPMQEEEIDYTDTNFILQNLSIVKPNFDNDKTYLLHARRDLADLIASQVRFYCYCAIDAFSRIPKVGTILVIGEGFIGARVINDLIDNGCREMLRICTRGDLTAAEWKARGVKADNNLGVLLDGTVPDIVILTVENASFTAVCKQLISSCIVTRSTFLISCSFGFQRWKLFHQVHTPNIFRTFVEPDEIFATYKKRTFNSIRNFTKSGKEVPGETVAASSTPSAPPLPPGVTSRNEFNGVSFLATRSLDVRNLVYQLENYYAIHHHGFSVARAKALKNVLGYVMPGLLPEFTAPPPVLPPIGRRSSSADESFEQMSIRKAMKTEAKLKSKVDNYLKRLGNCNACLFTYQEYFAQLVADYELQALVDQQFDYEENNPKSGPPQGYERHRTPSKTTRKIPIAIAPGRPMHDDSFLEAIFRNDEDYSAFSGPGFELMATWDRKSDKDDSNSPSKPHSAGEDRPASNASRTRSPAARPRHTLAHPHSHPTRRSVELDAEAMKDVEEFGRRLSNYADREATNIDRNYMQSYLEATQHGGW